MLLPAGSQGSSKPGVNGCVNSGSGLGLLGSRRHVDEFWSGKNVEADGEVLSDAVSTLKYCVLSVFNTTIDVDDVASPSRLLITTLPNNSDVFFYDVYNTFFILKCFWEISFFYVF